MADRNAILLQTKLHRPSITRSLIVRPQLIEQLNNFIGCPLILVSAPAGFGKTTLVCNWLNGMPSGQVEGETFLPSAWLSLDESDSDLNLFMRYIIAALRTIFNDACTKTLSLLHSRQEPPAVTLYTSFCNELEELPGEVILVLDDYHFIRGKAVHNLVIEMGRHWPKPLHLVLISRINPPLPIARLRAKEMISEIRTKDLRFTPEETAAYLSLSPASPLDQSTLQILEERFEGWPAGLHLAALSLHSASSQESVLLASSGENPNITGYLVDEVLSDQLPAIHTFLVKTSILDRFCAELCEAIIEEVDSAWNAQACLDWIDHSELFITPLDNHRKWYRYHHLFQGMLQQRLSAEMGPDAVANLHLLASAWFEDQGLLDEALHHALGAGDLNLAARQMYAGLRDVLNQEDRPTLERWLRLLPEDMIHHQPELLMIRVWALQFSWRLDLQVQVVQRVEQLLDLGEGEKLPAAEQQTLRGLILLPKAQQSYFSNQTAQAIDLSQQVLKLFPPSWTFVRGGAMLFLGMSLQASGQEAAAEEFLLDEYESFGARIDVYSLFLLQTLCFNYLNSGRLGQVRRTAKLLIQRATSGRMALMKYWGYWFLGVVCYQRNELESAAQYFTKIVDNRYLAQISSYRDAVAGLTLIQQIRRESSAAWQMVESISQFDLEQRGSEDKRTQSLRARLRLLQGDLDGAGNWVDTITGPPPDQAMLWLEEPQVTRARILLARDADTGMQPALQVMDTLAEIAGRTHNTRYKIEILALRAMALDTQGETNQAYAELKQAVHLARIGRFTRVFADLGQPMQVMLRQLADQGDLERTIRYILAAFPVDDIILDSSNGTLSQQSPVQSPLAEPLTHRELEVLTLLQEPLSIKEIALELNITYATTRRHTINLYGKLSVNKRWDAVARAIELGILSP